VPDSCSSSDFCTVKSCRCRTAHIGERRTVTGAGTIREQVASELLVEVTILAVLFCYYFATILLIITLQICYVWILSISVGYFQMGWAYFRERGFLKLHPPPSLSSHLSSSPMGVFSRDCGTYSYTRLTL